MLWKKKKNKEGLSISAAVVHATPPSEGKRTKSLKSTVVVSAVLLIVFGAVGTSGYFYNEYRKVVERQEKQSEVETIVAAISEHFELPADETPTLATVTDRDKLSSQDFFIKAENGDKVLLYEKLKKAVLYRPSTGKIINVAPINIKGDESATEAPQGGSLAEQAEVAGSQTDSEASSTEEAIASNLAPMEKAKVAIYNGSAVTGVTHKAEQDILGIFSEKVEVIAKESAKKSDYEGTLVVNLSGSRSVEASMIADALKGSIGELPKGEVVPSGADILVIIGNEGK